MHCFKITPYFLFDSCIVFHSVDVVRFTQLMPYCSGYQCGIKTTLKLSHVKYHFVALTLWFRNSDRAQWGRLVSDT